MRRLDKLSARRAPAQMMTLVSDRLRRFRHWVRSLPTAVQILAPVVGLGVLIGGLVFTSGGPGSYTLTAEFAESPGLYPGNYVDVLGLPVGHIISVSPHASSVTVVMHVNRDVRVPAGANALLMAPDVVNDRYVQLEPAYSGGPQLAPGSVIPPSRTEVPVSPDEVFNELDQLSNALGPKGANAHGALSQLFHSVARAYGNDGPVVHQTISYFGQALGALASDGPALQSLINNFGDLTHAASRATTTYASFANVLTTVSQALVGDSSDIHTALSNLQQALGQISSFLQTNGTALGASFSNLSQVAKAIGQQQQTLAQLLSVLPLTLQNVANAYDPNPVGGGGPALRTRYDPLSGSSDFANSICGNSVLRLLVLTVDPTQDKIPTIDLGCGVAYALQTLPVPPGASSGPNMTLQSLIAASKS